MNICRLYPQHQRQTLPSSRINPSESFTILLPRIRDPSYYYRLSTSHWLVRKTSRREIANTLTCSAIRNWCAFGDMHIAPRSGLIKIANRLNAPGQHILLKQLAEACGTFSSRFWPFQIISDEFAIALAIALLNQVSECLTRHFTLWLKARQELGGKSRNF